MKLSPMKDILEMAEERNIAYGAYVTVSMKLLWQQSRQVRSWIFR